jgi:hypothetical protein
VTLVNDGTPAAVPPELVAARSVSVELPRRPPSMPFALTGGERLVRESAHSIRGTALTFGARAVGGRADDVPEQLVIEGRRAVASAPSVELAPAMAAERVALTLALALEP